MPNIYFGISGNVAKNIDSWVRIVGSPDVFSEKDENIHKYSSKLLGKYEVLSLGDALKRFPDADVWVTYRKAKNTARQLLKVLPPERIHFFEADLEYRKGCRYLGNFMSYRANSFSPCCITGRSPIVKTSGTIEDRLSQWQTYTEQLVEDIRNGNQNDCENCHLLTYGFWPKTVALDELNFGSNQPGDICNFRCTYCFCEKTFDRLKNNSEDYTTFQILKELSVMEEFSDKQLTIQMANGEFCVNKNCDEMLDIFLNTNWKIVLLSNFSIYKEKLASLFESGRIIRAVVSLDSGTPETFRKIKRVDAFDKVVNNLRRYNFDKTELTIKYIFLKDINDNEIDIDQFYDIAKEMRSIISFSGDANEQDNRFTANMRTLTLRVIEKAKKDGVRVVATSGYLHPADKKFINDNYTS
ncbi:MAG: radical SAM protein [Bacillota bacterium]|nr:radical SAM protein [Bacillota bacterium]